jgi:hypothetical protein
MDCHAIRIIKPYMSLESLKIVYHSTFNSVINYGLPFWGISPHSKHTFIMQKRIVRIMLGCTHHTHTYLHTGRLEEGRRRERETVIIMQKALDSTIQNPAAPAIDYTALCTCDTQD